MEMCVKMICVKMTRTCSYGWIFEPQTSIVKMLIFFMQSLLIHFELYLFSSFIVGCLTLSWRRCLSYRNQSIDLTGFYMMGTSVIKKLISDVVVLSIVFDNNENFEGFLEHNLWMCNCSIVEVFYVFSSFGAFLFKNMMKYQVQNLGSE